MWLTAWTEIIIVADGIGCGWVLERQWQWRIWLGSLRLAADVVGYSEAPLSVGLPFEFGFADQTTPFVAGINLSLSLLLMMPTTRDVRAARTFTGANYTYGACSGVPRNVMEYPRLCTARSYSKAISLEPCTEGNRNNTKRRLCTIRMTCMRVIEECLSDTHGQRRGAKARSLHMSGPVARSPAGLAGARTGCHSRLRGALRHVETLEPGVGAVVAGAAALGRQTEVMTSISFVSICLNYDTTQVESETYAIGCNESIGVLGKAGLMMKRFCRIGGSTMLEHWILAEVIGEPGSSLAWVLEVTSASAERESKAIEVARVKANHDILLLKTRLEGLEMQLDKAQQREERSFATHKDFQDMHHQQMEEIRKEMCAQVESLQDENKHLSEKLSTSESKVQACTAEMNELKQKLESKVADCEDLGSRLAECQSLEKSLGRAETERESAKEETRATKLALDEARGSYLKSIANLEVSLISAVRASFRPYNNVNFVLNSS
ncbi:hypothetical protein THAOC_30046, partial [Thalassiosira oceanica]